MIKQSILLVFASVLMSACATTNVPQLQLSASNRCAAPEGVSLRYNTVVIALGQRPGMGYEVEVLGQSSKKGHYKLSYQERTPEPSKRYAQVLTSPCLMIVMPQEWNSIEVTNQYSGKTSLLTPADDGSLAVKKVAR